MSLTEEEKAKIREEEELRAQIRAEQTVPAGPANIEVTPKKKISSTRESISNFMWVMKIIIMAILAFGLWQIFVG